MDAERVEHEQRDRGGENAHFIAINELIKRERPVYFVIHPLFCRSFHVFPCMNLCNRIYVRYRIHYDEWERSKIDDNAVSTAITTKRI